MGDDSELLRHYADGKSQEAFARVVGRHLNLVYAAALRRTAGQHQLAEEVAQEVFCELSRKAAALADHPMLIAWLYKHTRFVALKLMRGESRRKQREQEAAALQELLGDAEAWANLHPLIDQAVDKLGADDRSAILLRYFDGQTFPAIGHKLGLTEDGARLRVGRAVDKLRRILARGGINSSAAGLAFVLAENATAAKAPAGLAGAISATAATVGVPVTGGLAAVLQFMSMHKVAVTLVGVAAIGAVGTSVSQLLEIERTRVALNAARAEYDRAQRLVADEARAALDSGQDGSARQVQSNRPKTGATTVATGTGASAAMTDSVYDNPEFRRALHDRFRAQARLSYLGLYRRLALAPQQIKVFEDAVATRDARQFQLEATAQARGWTPDDPAYVAQRAGILAEFRGAVAGAANFDEIARYETAAEAREWSTLAASRLFPTDTPLSHAQIDALTEAIAQHTDRGSVNWDRALAQAAAHLTATQLDVVRAVRTRADHNRQFFEAFAANRSGQP